MDITELVREHVKNYSFKKKLEAEVIYANPVTTVRFIYSYQN